MPSTLLIAATVSLAVLVGLVSTLVEGMRSALKQRFEVDDARIDRLNRLMHLLWIPLMPTAGWLVDAWGPKWVTFYGGCLLTVAAMAWMAGALNWASYRWSALVLSIGAACLTLGSIRLMKDVFLTRAVPDAAASLSVGFVFIGLAAVVNLYVLPWLLAKAGYLRGTMVMALGCLIPSFLIAFAEEPTTPPAVIAPIWGDPKLWLLAGIIFLFFPIEHSLDAWPKPYLGELGYRDRSIPYLMAGFWVCFLLMRLAMGFWFISGYELWMLVGFLLTSSMVLGNLVGAYAPSSGYVGFWMVGACYGPLLPAFLGLTMDIFVGSPAFGVGLMLALDSVAALAVQPWFMRYLTTHTARSTMRIPMILGLIMAILTLALALIRYWV